MKQSVTRPKCWVSMKEKTNIAGESMEWQDMKENSGWHFAGLAFPHHYFSLAALTSLAFSFQNQGIVTNPFRRTKEDSAVSSCKRNEEEGRDKNFVILFMPEFSLCSIPSYIAVYSLPVMGRDFLGTDQISHTDYICLLLTQILALCCSRVRLRLCCYSRSSLSHSQSSFRYHVSHFIRVEEQMMKRRGSVAL